MVMNHESLKSNPMFDHHRHFNEHQNRVSSDRRHRRGSYSEASSAYSGSDTMQVSHYFSHTSSYIKRIYMSVTIIEKFPYQKENELYANISFDQT